MNEITVKQGVVFGSGGGRELRCDVFTPENLGAPAPGLLLLHGGGWRAGDRGMMEGFGQRIAAEGFVCVASEYRLTSESPWPAQIEDVKSAIRWFRARSSELGADPSKIAAMGLSAGAHLSLLAAGTAGLPAYAGRGGNAEAGEELVAVVAVYPPVDFFVGETRPHGASPATALLGDAATADAARAASPLTHVGAGFPATFLLHGTADEVVPPSASQVMYEALVREQVPVELHMYAGLPHAFARQPEFIDLVCAEAVHFLRRSLGIATGPAPAQAAAAV